MVLTKPLQPDNLVTTTFTKHMRVKGLRNNIFMGDKVSTYLLIFEQFWPKIFVCTLF